ncbi:hypothetical protein P8452_01290 [Trifolium repens]|nr:hypothetical protein P8452_01290 [Trifolium repens]
MFSGAVLVRFNVSGNADTGKLLSDKISRIEVENENTYLLLSTNSLKSHILNTSEKTGPLKIQFYPKILSSELAPNMIVFSEMRPYRTRNLQSTKFFFSLKHQFQEFLTTKTGTNSFH